MTAAVFVGLAISGFGVVKSNHMLVMSGCVVPVWEFLATMDMDHEARTIRGPIWRRCWLTYWWPYKMLVPHRSEFSHSLLVGTPIRLVYVFLPFILIEIATSPFTSSELLEFAASNPALAWDWLWGWIQEWRWLVAGAVVADLVHLLKDGYLRYGLGGILFGR